MADPKAKTIQQTFGFVDHDLKMPKHDEIMFWLDRNIAECLPKWLGIGAEWTSHDLAESKQRVEKFQSERLSALHGELERVSQGKSLGPLPYSLSQHQEEKREEIAAWQVTQEAERTADLKLKIEKASTWTEYPPLPERPPMEVLWKKWEQPITTGGETHYQDRKTNKYVVGFADLAVGYKAPQIGLKDTWEHSLSENWYPKWDVSYCHETRVVYFEVKTEIASIGELIRQVNMYREYVSGQFYVVAPDDRYEGILREQRIGFVKYAP